MKTVSCLFVALLSLCITSTALANDADKTVLDKLRDRIVTLVEKPNLEDLGIDYEELKVQFMINDRNEIVVIDTNTSNNVIDQYVKEKLNYQKVKENNVTSGIYHVKITFQND